ncbi:MAG: class I SAM-dependent RNA methyltransferase [Bacteroidota bacterium]
MNQNKNQFELIAKTFFGLEDVLAEEITLLGGENIFKHNRAVSFTADKELMYKCNYRLRTALRILKPIMKFNVRSTKALYRSVKEYKWEKIFSVDETFAVDSVVSSEYFKHSKFAALKLKDAIVDRYRAKFGKRPSVDLVNPKVRIHLHIYNDQCTISLDSSGDSLHKRGYRIAKTIAPLNEALAAGMVMLSGWDKESDFIDPMCGSGTIPIEAALIALDIPPGYLGRLYGFQNWNDFDEKLWKKIESNSSVKKKININIIGSDKSEKAVEAALQNINRAKLTPYINIQRKYFDDQKPQSENGIIITNPPYGERLKEDQIFDLYKMIGDTFKTNFTGFDAWILSAHKTAMKHVGLKTSKRLTLYNGALECKFHKFSLYKGSKKYKD